MKVGVFLEQDVTVGGGFQQAYTIVDYLSRHPLDGVEFIFFVLTKKNRDFLDGLGVKNVLIPQKFRCFAHRAARKFLKLSLGLLIPFQGYIDDVLSRRGIDIVYFLTPSHYAMGLRKHNYIITIWDQCHRDWVEFPEVRNGLEFESREFLYKNVLAKAVAVFVDARESDERMRRRYGVDPERIHIVPFFPLRSDAPPDSERPDVDVCARYSIKKPFIFYPAQFWSHKNHCYIVDALKIIEKKYEVEAVFVGSDYGCRQTVMDYARRLGLEHICHVPGFVTRDELAAFYKSSAALVMPTYFGPTNIPPLEAFYFGCPVCYSDLPGLREQVGDAAFLIDLNDPASLAGALEIILRGGDEVRAKIDKGYERLKEFSGEKFLETLAGVLRSYREITRCG